jgi:hypothetical protein
MGCVGLPPTLCEPVGTCGISRAFPQVSPGEVGDATAFPTQTHMRSGAAQMGAAGR